MSDEESAESVVDHELDYDPNTIRARGTERTENERYQASQKLKQYPPGHIREEPHDDYVEVLVQPPVSIPTGFQTIASTGRILFAANGPDIHSFDILEKTHLSTWKWPKEKNFPKIPEPSKDVVDPNPPPWAVTEERIAETREKAAAKDKAAKEKAEAKKEGPAAKRRKLNAKVQSEEPMDISEPEADGTSADVTKDESSGDEYVDKLDPFPARHTNPELWHSAVVDPEAGKPDRELPNIGQGLNIDSVKYEKSSVRPPDEKPEGWKADQRDNWRRPDFRPGRRLLWKHQPWTATSDVPMVQCLSATADGKHVIAATGSDKTIWVFEHNGNGQLTLLSQRTMPKRPNAIAFANKDQTLLCADKFGDVYALPLIERKDVPLKATPSLLSRSATPATAKPYVSQANDKTVHSLRNRQALENQKKQEQKKAAAADASSLPKGINPKKDPTGDFYHKLIIGHVSMLTDVAVGRIPTVDAKSGRAFHKELIVTADRDEHIRVSRGLPQSHVIESFLLGHKEFVSKLHIPERYPNILISGGGDSYVYVWDYLTGELRSRQEMRKDLVVFHDADTCDEPPLAVSGITSYYDPDIDQTRIFVICENIPKVFTFHLDDEQILRPSSDTLFVTKPKHTGRIVLAGNPLGLTTFHTATSRGIIVTYDPYTAGSTYSTQVDPSFIQLIHPQGLSSPPKIEEITDVVKHFEVIPFTFRGDWEKALYQVEPLRKSCFDRDIAQKDPSGNYGSAATSTG